MYLPLPFPVVFFQAVVMALVGAAMIWIFCRWWRLPVSGTAVSACAAGWAVAQFAALVPLSLGVGFAFSGATTGLLGGAVTCLAVRAVGIPLGSTTLRLCTVIWGLLFGLAGVLSAGLDYRVGSMSAYAAGALGAVVLALRLARDGRLARAD